MPPFYRSWKRSLEGTRRGRKLLWRNVLIVTADTSCKWRTPQKFLIDSNLAEDHKEEKPLHKNYIWRWSLKPSIYLWIWPGTMDPVTSDIWPLKFCGRLRVFCSLVHSHLPQTHQFKTWVSNCLPVLPKALLSLRDQAGRIVIALWWQEGLFSFCFKRKVDRGRMTPT